MAIEIANIKMTIEDQPGNLSLPGTSQTIGFPIAPEYSVAAVDDIS